MDGNAGRQYQGFSYPTAPPTTGSGGGGGGGVGAGTGAGAGGGALPMGGMPFYGGGGVGATGLVRRTATTTAANGASPVSGGYGYFHRATSSGSHSAFAAGSDGGSSHGRRVGSGRGAGLTTAAPPPFSAAYPKPPYQPQQPQPPQQVVAVFAHAGPSAPMREDAGDEAGGAAPFITVDAPNSSNSSSAGNRGAVPWGLSPAQRAHHHPPHHVPPHPLPQPPQPPQSSSTAIAFLPPSNASNDGAVVVDDDSAAVNIGGDSQGNSTSMGPYSPHPAAGFSPFIVAGGGNGAQPSPLPPPPQQQQQGFLGGAAHLQEPFVPAVPPSAAPTAAKGFFKDMMSRLLSDLDEGGHAVSPDGTARREDAPRPLHQTRFGCPEDDLPLLEELGVFPAHIWQKAKAVLNPFKQMPMDSVEDTDLAGPLAFAVTLAFLLSLQGKIQFSAIYSLSVLGVTLFKLLLTFMHNAHGGNAGGSGGGGGGGGVPLQFIISSLGYALLPSLVLALLRTVQFWVAGSHSTFLLPLAFLVIAWSSWCATSLIVRGMNMESQRYLILYPMVLFYALFAALTIF